MASTLESYIEPYKQNNQLCNKYKDLGYNYRDRLNNEIGAYHASTIPHRVCIIIDTQPPPPSPSSLSSPLHPPTKYALVRLGENITQAQSYVQ